MPFNLANFKSRVKEANPTYERFYEKVGLFQKSSLHGLMAALERHTPPATAMEIAPLIRAIPTEKRKKYRGALAYLQGNFPGLMPIAPGQTHAPPEIQVTGPSGWQTVTVGLDAHKRTFKVYQQQHGESCGPSCVLMVLNQRGRITSEALVRSWFMDLEDASDSRVLDFSGGADFSNILRALNEKANIPSTERLDLVANGSVMRCTGDAPGVLRVGWPGGGGHFIVCVGKLEGQMFPERVYLDPWYGLVRNHEEFFPQYDTTGSSFKVGHGRGRITHLLTTG